MFEKKFINTWVIDYTTYVWMKNDKIKGRGEESARIYLS